MKRFCVLIEDDWELSGNGLGNVASHQYLPSLFFMKLAMRLGIKLTFMVDVAQQLVYHQNQDKDPNIRLQKKLWDENVLLMKEYGFDVQLHLHPQWHQSQLVKDLFYLSNKWNLGQYETEVQNQLISESINYLEQLLKPIDSSYKVIAFKGGSWGLQPSGAVLANMARNGIKIITGVRKGMYIPQNGVDYTLLEEEFLPYYPQFSDINQVSIKSEDLVVIPLQQYSPDLFTLAGLGVDLVKRKISKSDSIRHYYIDKIPSEIKNLSPLLERKKFKYGFRPYQTHLKIGNQPYSYLKKSFRSVIKVLEKTEHKRIPILIECHTKQYPQYFHDIEKFLTHVKSEYGSDLEFGDMTSFWAEVENKKQQIMVKHV